MRYPITRPMRARLVQFYYELVVSPGAEPCMIRNWADMITRLLASKPGMKRKLESTDMELSWKTLWRALQKELWPKGRAHDDGSVHRACESPVSRLPSRNVVNIFLYVAELCKRYFPAGEIPEILSTFIPLVTQDVGLIDFIVATTAETIAEYFNHGSSAHVLPSTNPHPLVPTVPVQDLGSI